jgi:hypothetical protein
MLYGKRNERRVVSSGLSSNFAKFHNTQMLIVALVLAIIGAGTVALSLALGW